MTALPAHRMPITRRAVLHALGIGVAHRLRPIVAGFTSIADELAALMRWCACGAPRFAGAG